MSEKSKAKGHKAAADPDEVETVEAPEVAPEVVPEVPSPPPPAKIPAAPVGTPQAQLAAIADELETVQKGPEASAETASALAYVRKAITKLSKPAPMK